MSPRFLRAYNRILRRTYPECRMRWSDVRECYLLELRANYARLDINPETYPHEAIDTFIQHRDGYQCVGVYGARALPSADRLVAYLLRNDTQRMNLGGGTAAERAARLADIHDERDAEREAATQRRRRARAREVGAELDDSYAWTRGRRVTVPRSYGAGA